LEHKTDLTQAELDDPQELTTKQVEEGIEGKDLPEKRFFNTQENPPSLKDRVKEKTEKILWNK
jgi:large subunit ribosomal protein L47